MTIPVLTISDVKNGDRIDVDLDALGGRDFSAGIQKLSVPHIKESHGLALDSTAVGIAGATAVVPPYQAMRIADKVTFTWQGYFQDAPEFPWSQTVSVDTTNVDQPLIFLVPRTEILFSDYAEISYSIEHAGGAYPKSDSETQIIRIAVPDSPRLPAISIKGHTGGVINPGSFPNGLTLQIDPIYTQAEVDDVVLMYWTGERQAQSVIASLQVTQSMIDSGLLAFDLAYQWLSVNSGAMVSAMYQYARSGAAESAAPLPLSVSRPLNLPSPNIENAAYEAQGRVWLAADTSGAWVQLPDEAEIDTNASVAIHWQGHPNGGQHIATSPVGGTGRRYFIPATAVAANMSANESRRFPVFYQVRSPAEGAQDSKYMNVRIEPLEERRYPDVQCVQAQGSSSLSLRNVPGPGADLYLGGSQLPAWPFMAAGQLLTIEASGVLQSGSPSGTLIVRAAVAVTSDEFSRKKVEAKLPYAFLRALMRNTSFTLKAKVSFDGGETYTRFRDMNLALTD